LEQKRLAYQMEWTESWLKLSNQVESNARYGKLDKLCEQQHDLGVSALGLN